MTGFNSKREAAADKLQEPVAWADLQKKAQQIVESKFLWNRFIDGTPLANDIACWMADFARQYTAPPQRPWVGLTDDETMLLANQTSGQNWGNESHIQRLRKTIENKLKEKNNGT